MKTANQLRSDIPAPPTFMTELPIDERGYPVPWFVEWVDGKPEFRAMSGEKLVQAVKQRLCWVCGKKLFREMVFVVGPMCSVNRVSGEPPSHRECARYAAAACPFLVKPHMIRREAGMPEEKVVTQGAILRNPGVTLLWYTRGYGVERVNPGVIFNMHQPFLWEWYAKGRLATRAEVLDAFEAGLPALHEQAEADGEEAKQWIARGIESAMRMVPGK